MTLPDRYRQLLVSIPKGDFYASDGQVLPNKSTPYELNITTGVANRAYGIFRNDQFISVATSNGSGVLIANIVLQKGTNNIRAVDSVTQQSFVSYITARDYATWLAAEAEILGDIDTNTEQILSDARLSTSSIALIETIFGKTVKTANNPNYNLDTYRELLQELRVAYRYYGGTIEGLSRVVRAFTQISPLIYKRAFGPSWILDKDTISPAVDVSGHTNYATSASLAAIQGTGAGISVYSIDKTVPTGTATIQVQGTLSPKKLRYKSSLSSVYGPPVNITSNGHFTLYDGEYTPSIYGLPETYDIETDQNDFITLEVYGLGPIKIQLTAGIAQTAADIATDINAAFNADLRYGATYNTTASVIDNGTKCLVLSTPNNAASQGGITIHPTYVSGDAAQTVFDLPIIRGGLSTDYSEGTTSITLTGDMSTWPSATSTDPLTVLVGRTIFTGPNISGTCTSFTPELVSVINVDRGTKVITLASPGLFYPQNSGALVEVYNQLPYNRPSTTSVRPITVNVTDFTKLPVITVSSAFTVSGTGVPDGWILTNNAGGAVAAASGVEYTYFNPDRDLPIKLSPDRMLSIPLPSELLKYKGYTAIFSVWGSDYDPTVATPYTTINKIATSFDNQATYTLVTPTINGLSVNATRQPQEYFIQVIIPANADRAWMRIKLTNNNGSFVIHKVRVTIPNIHSGLFLGSGTIPRGETTIKQGNLMYIWSPNALVDSEKSLLGTNNPVYVDNSHIDQISPDAAIMERFDVSTYNTGTPTNIFGVFNDTQMSAGTATNLDIILRTPARFSYMQPSVISSQTQIVMFDVNSPHVATLTVNSDQVKTNAILLEDGVPVTQDNWQFNSSTQIELLYGPSVTARYLFTYDALIQFESSVIDLGATFDQYIWLTDSHTFDRLEITSQEVPITVGIDFNANGVATLQERSNKDQSIATLFEDTGLSTRIVPQKFWSFINSQTVNINLGTFNQGSIYTLNYISVVNHPSSNVVTKLEVKSATTSIGLAVAPYAAITRNQVIDNTYRYHKLRLSVSNIRDIRDIRIHSLIIKGLHINGGSIPVLNP